MELQHQAQEQTRAVQSQADAAMLEARRALTETAVVRTTVEEALTQHLQASTSLSALQVSTLAQDTSRELQTAVQERRQLQERLHAQAVESERVKAELAQYKASHTAELRGQQAETERLRQELQKLQVAQAAQVQRLQSQRSLEQQTEAGQRQQMAGELEALRQGQSRGAVESLP